MKRWINLAARLYPAGWRSRYAIEFQALIDDVNPGWRELFDVLKGALKMRITNGATYLKLGAAFALFGAVAAIATPYLVPHKYMARAVLRVRPAADPETVARIEKEVLSRTSLSAIIQHPLADLYIDERAHQPLENVIETMRTRDIHIRLEGPSTFSISFEDYDWRKARAVVQFLMTRFTEQFVAAQQEGRLNPGRLHLEILKDADLPETPVRPNRLPIILMGTAIGLSLGLLSAAFLKLPQRALLFATLGLCGFLAGGALSLRIAPEYVSTSVIRVASYDQAFQSELAHIARPGLRVHLIHLDPNKTADLQIEFRNTDPTMAQATLSSVTASLIEGHQFSERFVRYQDGPHSPLSLVLPNRLAISLFGLCLGIFAATTTAYLLRPKGVQQA